MRNQAHKVFWGSCLGVVLGGFVGVLIGGMLGCAPLLSPGLWQSSGSNPHNNPGGLALLGILAQLVVYLVLGGSLGVVFGYAVGATLSLPDKAPPGVLVVWGLIVLCGLWGGLLMIRSAGDVGFWLRLCAWAVALVVSVGSFGAMVCRGRWVPPA